MDKRTKRIAIRFNEARYKKLKEEAKSSNLSVSEYLRRLLLGNAVSLINAKEFLPTLKSLTAELRQNGNNINQLTKYANYAEKNGIENIDIIVEFNRLLKERVNIMRKIEGLNRKIMKA